LTDLVRVEEIRAMSAAYGDGVAVVERRDGSLTRVAIEDIVAAKPLPK
jgi:hypothetical protein